MSNLLPRVYLQPHQADGSGPVLVHGNCRDELDLKTALQWRHILDAFIFDGRHVIMKAKDRPNGLG